MQRHPALQDLSRDHHSMLLHAQRLAKAADVSPNEALKASRAFLSYWPAACIDHLDEEEQFVLPLAEHAIAARYNMVQEVLRESADALRVSLMEPSLFRDAVRATAEALRTHVAFCESTMFQEIQDEPGDKALQAAGKQMLAFRKQRRPDAIGPNATENCYL